MDIRFPPVMLGNFSACFIQKEKRERGGGGGFKGNAWR